ncbi:hypothetical protein BJX70DRAFT_375529 [Aspergillus crustosus]
MHLLTPLVTTLTALTFTLLSPTTAYKIRAFSGPSCTGSAREINVWDNTCRDTDVPATRSFRVLAYGAGRQRANFYESDGCWYQHQGWWADGGSDTFIKGRCVTLDSSVRAFGSISA